LENVGVGVFDVFETGEEEQCLSVIVRRRGHDIGVVDGAEGPVLRGDDVAPLDPAVDLGCGGCRPMLAAGRPIRVVKR
jgi:hypothetical protein